MVVYFSGTGNSRWCARMLADGLDDEIVDCAGFIKNGIKAELISTKPWIFVSPTYAWQIPRIFEEFVRNSWLQGEEDAYFVMTCGSGIGAAGEKLEQFCCEVGLHYRGVLQVVMPENYIALYTAPGEEESRRILRAAKPCLNAAIRRIKEGGDLPKWTYSVEDKLKSGTVNKMFYRHIVKAKAFYATDVCIGCGSCVASCVLNNISLKDDRPVWGNKCTHCMACICGCPMKAIEYGQATRGKIRYQCDEKTIPPAADK